MYCMTSAVLFGRLSLFGFVVMCRFRGDGMQVATIASSKIAVEYRVDE
jgi:hypothetical protein